MDRKMTENHSSMAMTGKRKVGEKASQWQPLCLKPPHKSNDIDRFMKACKECLCGEAKNYLEIIGQRKNGAYFELCHYYPSKLSALYFTFFS